MENLEYYLEYLEYQKHYSFYTVDNYREDLEEFFAYLDREGLSFLKLEYSDIRLYLMYLKDERKLKASSIDRHLSSLRGYYQYLEKENKVKSNVFSFIRGPKNDKILHHYFEYNEIEELFSINDMNNPLGVRNQLILELLYGTGVRVSELVNIKINDINKLLFSDKSISQKISTISEVDVSRYPHSLQKVIAQIKSVLDNSIDLNERKKADIEYLSDELNRARYEDEKLYVCNNVTDNCLSALKHETMYYPSRIRQLVDEADKKIQP